MTVLVGAEVEHLKNSATELIDQAKELTKRFHDAVESENFSIVGYFLTDMATAVSRAEAAKAVLRGIEEEHITELDKKSATRLLDRFQKDLKAFMHAETRPAYVRVFQNFVTVLEFTLERIAREEKMPF